MKKRRAGLVPTRPLRSCWAEASGGRDLGLRLGLLLRPRRGVADALVDMSLELGEIVDEQLDQLRRGGVVLRRVGPGVARIEDRTVDAGDRDGDLEAEI